MCAHRIGGWLHNTGAGVRTKDAANPATANSLYFLTPDTDYTCYVLSYATPDASDTPVCSDPVSVITPPCTQDSVTAATAVTTVVDGPNDPATTWTATWKSGVCNNAFLMKCVPKSLGEDCTSTAQGVRTQDVNTTITRALYLLDPGSDYYCYVLSYYTTDYSSPPVCSASILHTTTAGPPGRWATFSFVERKLSILQDYHYYHDKRQPSRLRETKPLLLFRNSQSIKLLFSFWNNSIIY